MDNFTGIACFFQSWVSGFELQQSEWHASAQTPMVATYSCTSGSGLIIEFRLNDVSEFTEAMKHELTEKAREIADEISFHCTMPVPDPALTGYAIMQDGVEDDAPVARRVTVAECGLSQASARAHILRVANDTDVANVKVALTSTPQKSKVYHAQFREALNAPDTVDRFMALYRIIASFTGDTTQENNDRFMKAFVPNIQEQQNPKGKMETIYTRLRNEIGHVRTGTTPKSIRRDVENVLPDFVALVKQAVDNQA